MTLYDEYCYNLMESAIKAGAEGDGLPKEACVAYMNIMFGARGLEEYAKKREEEEKKERDKRLKELINSGLNLDLDDIEDETSSRTIYTDAAKESEDTEDGKEMGD